MNRKRRLAPGSRARETRTAYLFLLPAIVLLVLFLGVPLVVSAVTSLQFNKLNVPGVYLNFPENYSAVFSDKFFGMTLRNTFWWVAVSILFQSVLGLTLALLLNQKFRGKGVYQALVLLPWAVPGFLTALTWKWLFNGQYGAINDILMRLQIVQEPIAFLARTDTSLPAVIIANIWYGVPFFAIMLYSALQSIPGEVYEAASIDGASAVQKFSRITLAYIKPTVISTILLRVIWVFNSADMIQIMTGGGPRNSSATMASYILQKAFSEMNFGQAAALGIFFLAVLLAYTVVYMVATKFGKAGDF